LFQQLGRNEPAARATIDFAAARSTTELEPRGRSVKKSLSKGHPRWILPPETSTSRKSPGQPTTEEDSAMIYARPNQPESKVHFKSRYQNYIGGEWVKPVKEKYFENVSPVTGKPFCEIPRSTAEDIEKALDAAHAARAAWGNTSPTERAAILNRIADRIEQNLEMLAVAETWDNGKPVRETLAADIPLAVDHFRYFAGCIRAQEGTLSQIDATTVAYHLHEPLGVVGQIIPWNFPLLMATWKLAPALAAGNCVVLKPAEQTPATILLLAELVGDLLPPGVLNIVNGFGVEAGKPLASSPRIAKVAFTGETTTGRLIMQYASENLIPVTLELGGKSPNIFFEDVLAQQDDFVEKCLEGFTMFALNQGEVCTCPSRALISAKIYGQFLEKALERTRRIKAGNPLDTDTMIGAQASSDQLEKILSYIDIGKQEGAKLLTGGHRAEHGGDLAGGYYVAPTIFSGSNRMRIFQEEIFGPVVSVTSFQDEADAIAIANDSLYGLGAGLWTRDGTRAYRVGRAIQAGRVWTNCYHLYPAHAAFGGYKQSGIGRENHKMMLSHYQQTKNLMVSYDPKPMGFF
jgi:aldehyde dehydrogenase